MLFNETKSHLLYDGRAIANAQKSTFSLLETLLKNEKYSFSIFLI
jgi:hypothetical protein